MTIILTSLGSVSGTASFSDPRLPVPRLGSFSWVLIFPVFGEMQLAVIPYLDSGMHRFSKSRECNRPILDS